MGELGEQRCHTTHHGPHQEAGSEDTNKVQSSDENVIVSIVTRLSLGHHTTSNSLLIIFQSFNQNNGHSIIENRLSKHKSVQIHINIQIRKYC